jgi:hypothetical protein
MRKLLDAVLPIVNLGTSRFGSEDDWETLNDIEMAILGQRPLVLVHDSEKPTVVLDLEILRALLTDYLIEPTVNYDGGEVTIAAGQFGVLGFGSTLEEAIDDFIEELGVYAVKFFENSKAKQFDRVAYLTLLHFVLTPPDEQEALLLRHH